LNGLNEAGLRSELLSLVGSKYGDERFQPADCWGFVRYCYSLAGIDLPKNIWSCRHICREVSGEPLRLLDVIYLRTALLSARHVGVALDNIYVLQSSEVTNGVAALRINRPGIRESIEGVYRLKPNLQGLTSNLEPSNLELLDIERGRPAP